MSVKELHKNLKNIPDIVADGTEISIFKNSKPAFKIVPFTTRNRENKKKYTLADYKKLQFTTNNPEDRYLSENIDKIVYGL